MNDNKIDNKSAAESQPDNNKNSSDNGICGGSGTVKNIKGLQKTTLLDFPGRVACTVFFGGCNLRCPFCHNASLVMRPAEAPDIDENEIYSFLKKRVGLLDGVCITGGEPLLNPNITDFICRLKSLGYPVKLDTNGTRPKLLKQLVNDKMIDYVAMDIKNSRENYSAAVGIPDFDVSPIEESAEFLLSGTVQFEFRTTLVKNIHTEKDIERIGEWLCGNENYFLQAFVDSGDLLNPNSVGFDKNEYLNLYEIAKKYLPNSVLRGL